MHPHCRCVSMSTIDFDAVLASGSARRVSESAVEIVTPGHHNDPQGDSMPSCGCGDPGCLQCHPLTAMRTASLGSMPSWSSPGTIMMSFDLAREAMCEEIANVFKLSPQDLGLPKQNKEQSMSPDTQRVINDLRGLDESTLPHISREIDNIKARNKERIADGLKGVADLETLKESDVRCFAIAYYQNGKVCIARGVEFGDTELIGEKDVDRVHRVYVQGRDYPVCGPCSTMPELRKKLIDNNIVFCVSYYKD